MAGALPPSRLPATLLVVSSEETGLFRVVVGQWASDRRRRWCRRYLRRRRRWLGRRDAQLAGIQRGNETGRRWRRRLNRVGETGKQGRWRRVGRCGDGQGCGIARSLDEIVIGGVEARTINGVGARRALAIGRCRKDQRVCGCRSLGIASDETCDGSGEWRVGRAKKLRRALGGDQAVRRISQRGGCNGECRGVCRALREQIVDGRKPGTRRRIAAHAAARGGGAVQGQRARGCWQ